MITHTHQHLFITPSQHPSHLSNTLSPIFTPNITNTHHQHLANTYLTNTYSSITPNTYTPLAINHTPSSHLMTIYLANTYLTNTYSSITPNTSISHLGILNKSDLITNTSISH